MILSLFTDEGGGDAACMWPEQLRRRADVLKCREEINGVATARTDASHTATIFREKALYWMIVGDSEWLFNQAMTDPIMRAEYACWLYPASEREETTLWRTEDGVVAYKWVISGSDPSKARLRVAFLDRDGSLEIGEKSGDPNSKEGVWSRVPERE